VDSWKSHEPRPFNGRGSCWCGPRTGHQLGGLAGSGVGLRAQRSRLSPFAAALALLLLLLAVQLIGAIPAPAVTLPPSVAAVQPDSGPTSGGTPVTVTGSNLTGATALRFGNVAATSFTVTSGSVITAVSPSQAEGPVHVTVTTPGGTSPTSDCGDSGEGGGPPTLLAPPCDRFQYYGELRGGTWSTTGLQGKGAAEDQSSQRETATLLLNGKVLFTGVAGAELYDPATGQWSSCPRATAGPDCPGPMVITRVGHTATLLKDGRVLVAGGDAGGPFGYSDFPVTAELYDPGTGKFTRTGDLHEPRRYHTATLLPDGRVLVAGGVQGADERFPTAPPGNAAEIYNPSTGQWTDAKPMVQGVDHQTATLLASGKVLVAGGRVPANPTNATDTDTSQLYDPGLDVWLSCPLETAATADCPGPLNLGRYDDSATVLADGRILAAGGVKSDGVVTYSTAELYDPTRGIWTETGRMGEARYYHVAARLPNGRVLVAGGGGRYGFGRYQPVSSAELYDPASGRWSQAPFMPDANAGVGVALPTGPWAACATNCGKVLVVRTGAVRSLLFSPTPEVSAVTPPTGSASGGTSVTITGTGLASVSSVRFGGVEAQRIDPDGADPDGKLVAVAPPHAPGTVDVTVTADGGSSAVVGAGRFSYVADAGAGSGAGVVGAGVAGAVGAAGAVSGLTPGTLLGNQPGRRPVSGVPPSVSERLMLRRCLAGVASHARRERRLSRRGAARQRARARRHLRRHAASGRRRCLMPGRVGDLKARALSASRVMLSFSAPGSVGASPPPTGRFIVKQSLRPITSERDFRRALTLCRGLCRFRPIRLGQPLSLTITDLRAHATYYYAIKAVGASGQPGPRSRTVRATTRSASRRWARQRPPRGRNYGRMADAFRTASA